MSHPTQGRPDNRPDNREVENEQVKRQPGGDGPPRPATEPAGSEGSSQSDKLETDPQTGEQKS
jgi:hypothetical protein